MPEVSEFSFLYYDVQVKFQEVLIEIILIE